MFVYERFFICCSHILYVLCAYTKKISTIVCRAKRIHIFFESEECALLRYCLVSKEHLYSLYGVLRNLRLPKQHIIVAVNVYVCLFVGFSVCKHPITHTLIFISLGGQCTGLGSVIRFQAVLHHSRANGCAVRRLRMHAETCTLKHIRSTHS